MWSKKASGTLPQCRITFGGAVWGMAGITGLAHFCKKSNESSANRSSVRDLNEKYLSFEELILSWGEGARRRSPGTIRIQFKPERAGGLTDRLI